MKKLFSLFLMLCLAVSLCVGVSVTAFAAEDDELPVVYIYDEQEWNLSVYCYSGGADFGTGWPGSAPNRAPELGEDWYSFTLPQDPGTATVNLIIFNADNEGPDRQNVVYKKGAYYHTYGAASFTTQTACKTDAEKKRPELVSSIYIYNFSIEQNKERWDTVYATCYNDRTGEQLGEGTYLTAASGIGAHWYQYNLTQEAKDASKADYKFKARVVVKNGESGREQLTIVSPVEARKYYNTYREYGFENKTTASNDRMNCVYSYPKTGTTTIYFYNSQRWKTVYAYAYWTDTAANSTTVEDFGGWPGKAMREVSGRENWYSIDVPQDVAILSKDYGVQSVGVVFSGPKGRAEQDSSVTNKTKIYFNYKGTAFSSFAEVEAVTEMVAPLPDVEDFMMDFTNLDTTEKTDRVTEYPSLTAPIVVLSVAAAALIAVGTVLVVFTVRRKKK